MTEEIMKIRAVQRRVDFTDDNKIFDFSEFKNFSDPKMIPATYNSVTMPNSFKFIRRAATYTEMKAAFDAGYPARDENSIWFGLDYGLQIDYSIIYECNDLDY